MKTKFLDTIKKYSMFADGDRVVVGLSGGADSVCLVSLLDEFKDKLGITLCAVHVNHCIRGEEAERDEQFVRSFCKEKNIPLTVFRRDIPRISAETGESTELAARRVRYECFNECQTDKIATAHSASDRIETLLFNLSRGASLKGLCSIPPVRENIVRPLIGITRGEIEEYCKENLIDYITDSTNLTDEYTRNKFRLNVIPEFNSINPAFEKNALRCIELLNDENAYIERLAGGLLEKSLLPDGRLSLRELLYEDEVIFRRAVINFLERRGVCEYEYSHIGIITESRGKKFAVCLPGNIRVESDGDFLYVEENSEGQVREPLNEYAFNKSDGFSFQCGNKKYSVTISADKPEKKGVFCADAGKIGDALVFRSRLPGDTIKRGYGRCSKSLRKLFNEIKIPAADRDFIYVLADEKGVVFVENIGFDARCLCDRETEKYLIIETEEFQNEE